MAPVPPTTTGRLRASYEGPFGKHTMLFHQLVGSTFAEFRDGCRDVIATLTECQWNGTTWGEAEYAVPGVSLFFPVAAWTPLVAVTSASPSGVSSPSVFVQFGGRDTSLGVRKKLYVYETLFPLTQDMRYGVLEQPEFANVVAALEDEGNVQGNVAGNNVQWEAYANVGTSRYLTRKARS